VDSAFGNNYFGEDGYDFALGNKGTVIRVLDKVTFQPQENHSTQNAETPDRSAANPTSSVVQTMTIR